MNFYNQLKIDNLWFCPVDKNTHYTGQNLKNNTRLNLYRYKFLADITLRVRLRISNWTYKICI